LEKHLNNSKINLQRTLYASKNPTRRWLHETRYQWIIQQINQFAIGCDTPSYALEFGIGSGIYLPYLAKNFDEVFAADIEEEFLSNASVLQIEHHNLHVINDDLTKSKLKNISFDLILCSEILEHIKDLDSALNNLKKLLKPSGVLIITVPQRYSVIEICSKIAFLPLIVDVVRWIYREPIIEMGHINTKSSISFAKILSSHGFQIIKVDKFGLYIPLIAEFTSGNLIFTLEKWLRRNMKSPLSHLLSTQAYIVKR